MRHISRLIAATILVATCVSCGNAVRDGQSPVFLVVNSLQATPGRPGGAAGGVLASDVLTIVTSGGVCTIVNPCPTIFDDFGIAGLSLALKNIGSAGSPNAPTSNNAVTITRVHVEYVRSDGRNTPGVDVPFPFDAAATVTVTGTSAQSFSFEIVRHVAKQEPPLIQLVNSPNIITTIAHVTFYGKDQVGNDVSAAGTIQINFGNFGDS